MPEQVVYFNGGLHLSKAFHFLCLLHLRSVSADGDLGDACPGGALQERNARKSLPSAEEGTEPEPGRPAAVFAGGRGRNCTVAVLVSSAESLPLFLDFGGRIIKVRGSDGGAVCHFGGKADAILLFFCFSTSLVAFDRGAPLVLHSSCLGYGTASLGRLQTAAPDAHEGFVSGCRTALPTGGPQPRGRLRRRG
jgi:hypothetical protein